MEKLPVVTLFGTNEIKLTLVRVFTAADINKEGHFVVELDKVTLKSAAMKFVELKGQLLLYCQIDYFRSLKIWVFGSKYSKDLRLRFISLHYSTRLDNFPDIFTTVPAAVTANKGDTAKQIVCEVKSPDDMDVSERPKIGWSKDGAGLLPSTKETVTRADQSELELYVLFEGI